MDILDDIFATINLKGTLYFRTDFSGPWGVTVPDLGQAARFHLVVQGQCHVSFPSGHSTLLNPGDLVLIPNGSAHVLADEPGRPNPPLETVLKAVGYAGEGVLVVGDADATASTQMICGHLNFREGADHPILRSLPEYVAVTNARRAAEPWLDELLRLIARRLFAQEIASATVVTRLSEIVFIELLRIGAEISPALASVFHALNDRQIGQALRLIHTRPDEIWTVESLARQCGMSRSRFAERFGELVGMSPMAYLADWRLQKALALLSESRHSIKQVAFKSGYRSPAAFTRAFSSKFGVSPKGYRTKVA